MLVEAIEGIAFEKNESLLPLSSALEALAITSKDMPSESIDKLQTKLADSISALSKSLTSSSRGDIFLLSRRLLNFGFYLLKVT